MNRELMVVQVTNNPDDYPELAEVSADYPELVKCVEDEADIFVVDPKTDNFGLPTSFST